MKHHRGWGLRGALLAAAAGTFIFSTAAHAQAGETPGAELRRQLGELAANPSSIAELVETGRAALAVGDGEAALGFFTRANELAPRDARVTAALAAANARTGNPETALLLFSQAVSLGAPESEIAGERGLAYDLLGQTARAQQDYLASLRHREDAEVRHRLALSLAISGQRDAALRLVDDKARQGDRAAQRARIMVLALSGDVPGATDAARASLPAHAAQAITPFLPRLASLSPGDMASAANLGRVPGGSVRTASISSGRASADPGALAFAGGGSSLTNRLPVAPAVSSSDVRRRPGGLAEGARVPSPIVQPERNLASSSLRPVSPTEARGGPETRVLPHPHEPLRLTGTVVAAASAQVELAGEDRSFAAAETVQPIPADAGSAQVVEAAQEAAPVQLAALQPPAEAEPEAEEEVVDGAEANLAVWNSGAAPARETRQAPAAATTTRPGFSDVVATVSSLSTERPSNTSTPRNTARERNAGAPRTTRAAQSTRSTPQQTPARTTNRTSRAAATTARASGRAATPARAHPSRVWVQLGVSQNRAGFTYEINRMRRAAPEVLRNQTAHTAPLGSSHRLLVGPFPSETAARTVINGLRQKNIPSMTWTSPAGTEVARFTAR